MKPLRPIKKWIFAATGFLLTLLILKIAVFWTAKPRVTVDYVAEYNRMTRPQDFDPNDNADEFYKESGKAYISPSASARYVRNKEINDLNETDKVSLKEWIAQNARCLKFIEEGNKKRFFWVKEDETEDVPVVVEN